MADVQIAVIDQQNTQIALAAPSETEVTVAVPGVQGPVGEGVPAGGTANQVLFKQSGTDYDTAWSEITSEMIGDLEIVNADVAAAAAIDGTKISPNFGSQNITTTGTATAAALIPSGSSVPTNGVYLPSANNVAISTNGTGRLFVDSSGDVNISTSKSGQDLTLTISNTGDSNASTNCVFSAIQANRFGGRITFGRENGNSWTSASANADGYISFSPVLNGADTERLRITSAGTLMHLGTGDSTTPAVQFNGSAPANSMVMLSDGKVGLGTSSPGAKLDVWPATSDAAFRGSSGISVQVPAFEFIGYNTNTSNGGLDIRTNLNGTFTDKVRITNDGLVGIGTTSPAVQLEVKNTSSGVSAALTSSNTGRSELLLGDTDDINIQRIISDHSNNSFHIHTNNSERMRIDSSGRLGLGTSSPNAGRLVITSSSDGGIGGSIVLENSNNSDTDKVGIALRPNGSATTAIGSYGESRIISEYVSGSTNGANNLQFWTHSGDGTVAQAIHIDSSQRVGIGTASPDGTLHVNAGGTYPSYSNFIFKSSANYETTLYLNQNSNGNQITANAFTESLLINAAYGTTGNIRFNTAGGERARIDSSGRLLVGTSSARASAGVTGQIQLEGTTYNNSSINLINNANDLQPPYLVFGKQRSGSAGGATVVQSGDYLGRIDFAGGDGTDLASTGAWIGAIVDGTPGANDMPGRLVFSTTADGASSPTERMRIDNAGTTTLTSAAATAPFIAKISTSEAARIDSSGRLLVGTSTSTGANSYTGLVVKSITSTNTPGEIILQNGYGNALNANSPVGSIVFQDNTGDSYAQIVAAVDAQDSATGDFPGRLVFSTTADGASSPTERMRITSDAYVRLASGTGGIQFNGDTASANALDDYEEGTWTPSVTGWTSITYGANRNGFYTKVGRQVFVSFYMQINAGTSSASAVTITGLPFSNNASNNGNGGSLTFNDLPTNTVNNILAFISSGSSTVALYEVDAGTVINSDANISAIKYLSGVISYFV